MQAFLVSSLAVAIGEIGDKTQLLALLLAARFRRPIPIVLGILFATLFNHSIASLVGVWIRTAMTPEFLRYALGVSFIAIAIWAIKPDRLEKQESAPLGRYGIFALTLITFFLAEMGDKTQMATIALAARFDSVLSVLAGTTAGMLIADVPAVVFGNRAAVKIPLKAIRCVAASLFAAMGLAVLGGFTLAF